MSNVLHNESKKEFQLERLILFSDAVFAIAITLLVIEIKIPEVEHPTDSSLLQSLRHLAPKVLGFIVSFILIGLYWTIHHRMFGFVTSYDKRLVILNLFFLFFIVLMPFSTGFYSEYAGPMVERNLKIPFSFYVLNFFGLGFMNYLMWRYISNPKKRLTVPAIDEMTLKLAKLRSIVVPSIFLLSLPVAFITNVRTAVYVLLLIPVILTIVRKKIKNKYKLAASN